MATRTAQRKARRAQRNGKTPPPPKPAFPLKRPVILITAEDPAERAAILAWAREHLGARLLGEASGE